MNKLTCTLEEKGRVRCWENKGMSLIPGSARYPKPENLRTVYHFVEQDIKLDVILIPARLEDTKTIAICFAILE